MTGPFEKGISYFLLLLILAFHPMIGQAQQRNDALGGAVEEARDAGISESVLNRILALGYERQVDPSAMEALLKVLTQCQVERIPLQPFLSKIEEGLAKKVSASRIEQVLKNKLADYRFTVSLIHQLIARQGQGEGISEEYLIRITETLSCGVSREDLTQLLGKTPAPPLPFLARGAEVLASLKQIHFDPKLSEEIVDTGLKERFFTGAQRDFVRILVAARAKGLHDDEIADAALGIIKKGRSQADLLSRLGLSMQDLDRQTPQRGKGNPGPGTSSGKADAGASFRGQGGSPGEDSGSGGSSGAGSGVNGGSEKNASSAPSETEETQGEGNLRFTAAGSVAHIDPVARTIKLNIEKANRVLKARIGKATTFTVGDHVKVRSEGSEPGLFDLDLGDIQAGESRVRVLGKKLAGAGYLITRIVVGLNGEGAEGNKSSRFTAFGTATEIDAAASTVTVRIENADDVLSDRVGDAVTFYVGENTTVTEESPNSSIAGLSLYDIVTGEGYLKVVGRKLEDGGYSVARIVIVLDE